MKGTHKEKQKSFRKENEKKRKGKYPQGKHTVKEKKGKMS